MSQASEQYPENEPVQRMEKERACQEKNQTLSEKSNVQDNSKAGVPEEQERKDDDHDNDAPDQSDDKVAAEEQDRPGLFSFNLPVSQPDEGVEASTTKKGPSEETDHGMGKEGAANPDESHVDESHVDESHSDGHTESDASVESNTGAIPGIPRRLRQPVTPAPPTYSDEEHLLSTPDLPNDNPSTQSSPTSNAEAGSQQDHEDSHSGSAQKAASSISSLKTKRLRRTQQTPLLLSDEDDEEEGSGPQARLPKRSRTLGSSGDRSTARGSSKRSHGGKQPAAKRQRTLVSSTARSSPRGMLELEVDVDDDLMEDEDEPNPGEQGTAEGDVEHGEDEERDQGEEPHDGERNSASAKRKGKQRVADLPQEDLYDDDDWEDEHEEPPVGSNEEAISNTVTQLLSRPGSSSTPQQRNPSLLTTSSSPSASGPSSAAMMAVERREEVIVPQLLNGRDIAWSVTFVNHRLFTMFFKIMTSESMQKNGDVSMQISREGVTFAFFNVPLTVYLDIFLKVPVFMSNRLQSSRTRGSIHVSFNCKRLLYLLQNKKHTMFLDFYQKLNDTHLYVDVFSQCRGTYTVKLNTLDNPEPDQATRFPSVVDTFTISKESLTSTLQDMSKFADYVSLQIRDLSMSSGAATSQPKPGSSRPNPDTAQPVLHVKTQNTDESLAVVLHPRDSIVLDTGHGNPNPDDGGDGDEAMHDASSGEYFPSVNIERQRALLEPYSQNTSVLLNLLKPLSDHPIELRFMENNHLTIFVKLDHTLPNSYLKLVLAGCLVNDEE